MWIRYSRKKTWTCCRIFSIKLELCSNIQWIQTISWRSCISQDFLRNRKTVLVLSLFNVWVICFELCATCFVFEIMNFFFKLDYWHRKIFSPFLMQKVLSNFIGVSNCSFFLSEISSWITFYSILRVMSDWLTLACVNCKFT